MIYYVGYFSLPSDSPKRYVSPAANTVFLYTLSVLCNEKRWRPITVVNNAVIDSNVGCCKTKQFLLNDVTYLYRPCFYLSRKIRTPKQFMAGFWLKKLLLKRCTKDDLLIVYHSLSYMKEIEQIKKKSHCKLILHVEEKYGEVNDRHQKAQKDELSFLDKADGYILSSEVLRDSIPNAKMKPNSIIYGSYEPIDSSFLSYKFNDGKIHLLYSGTLDKTKRGADNAIAAMQYLDSRFVLHILSGENPKRILSEIDEISPKIKSTIIFEGAKLFEEYERFASKCDIGLSTQDQKASFNQSSFPSKILSYLRCGLKVVSCASVSVTSSALAHSLFLYKKDSPEEIAQEILVASKANENCDPRVLLASLDTDFKRSLEKVIEKIIIK